jgi:hypothetical protein
MRELCNENSIGHAEIKDNQVVAFFKLEGVHSGAVGDFAQAEVVDLEALEGDSKDEGLKENLL